MRHEPLRLADALVPVREALLASARDDAAATRSRSTADARTALASAAEQAEQIRRRARLEGIADADAAVAADRRDAQRDARAMVLRARREAYDRLREAARARVRALRDEPDFPAARQRLEGAVHARLGPDARIVDSPDGGLIGVTAGRRLDLSLRHFADRATDTVLAHATAEEPT